MVESVQDEDALHDVIDEEISVSQDGYVSADEESSIVEPQPMTPPEDEVNAATRPTKPESTKFPAPLLSTIYDGKPSTFADLFRTFETYIGDTAADQFQPLINFCGTHHQGFRQLTGPASSLEQDNEETATRLSEPIALRHIHSTPLVHTPSILMDEDEDEPPPIGLEILSRSRSTPLSTSANSAFGAIFRPTLPVVDGPDDRSAFSLPPYRLKPTLSDEPLPQRESTFNPILCETDMEVSENTSIEVTDVPIEKPAVAETEQPRSTISQATSRASKFLPRFARLRGRRRNTSGRENPAQPEAISEELSRSVERGASISVEQKGNSPVLDPKDIVASCASPQDPQDTYDALGEGIAGSDSSTTVPSPTSFHAGSGERVSSTRGLPVPTEVKGPQFPGRGFSVSSPVPSQITAEHNSLTPQSQDSPDTSRSFGTTYTSGHTTYATFSTGQTSLQTSNLSAISETDLEVMEATKSGKHLVPGIDTITEGEAQDAAASRPHFPGYIECSGSPASLREGANVPPERFFTMAGSFYDKLGLNGRLRTLSSLRRSASGHSPTTVSSSSMTTNSSASSAQEEPPRFVSYLDRKMTSDLTMLRESDERSSPRAFQDREERESSPASDILGGYPDVVFEEAEAPLTNTDMKTRPRPVWPAKGFPPLGRKVGSLPPRSPAKGRTQTPPPPRGGGVSPAYEAVSPPRTIVNHSMDSDVPKPDVIRTTPGIPGLVTSERGSEVLSSSGNVDYAHVPGMGMSNTAYEVVRMGTNNLSRNYYAGHVARGPSPLPLRVATLNDDQGIEILKTDSKEEASHSRSPSTPDTELAATEC
eukprot:Nitzschia sp. Nitz4//scaffold2_size372955//92498//94960//NITZ4_000387-RA/size372955-processed-gene-0.485-mRNA-1//-1//CDS//3329546668//5675//frame0